MLPFDSRFVNKNHGLLQKSVLHGQDTSSSAWKCTNPGNFRLLIFPVRYFYTKLSVPTSRHQTLECVTHIKEALRDSILSLCGLKDLEM